MEEKYSKFIGVGSEGIKTLNSFKNKLEKNFNFEEINLNQDVDKEYVRSLLDGIEILFISYSSEEAKVKDIVKAISFMANERRVICIGLDCALKENKDDMGLDKEIKINKYNSEKVQDLINIVVESVDENLFLAIDYSDLKEIFAKDSAISYSIEEFEKEATIDEIAKTLTEETYTTVGEEAKKKALVFYEMPSNLIENELIFINEVNMKINEILGDTYDMMFSYNATDDDNEKIKICLISVKAISFMANERRVICIGLDCALKENKDDMGLDKEIKINKYNSEKVQELINIVVESVDENLFLAIDYSDLKEIFAKDSAISYSIEEFEKEVSIDEIAKTLTEETYTTVGEEVKKKALVFYEMPRNLIENELIFINEVNMKINEILGDTYDMMFSYNATDDDNEKIKICLISK